MAVSTSMKWIAVAVLAALTLARPAEAQPYIYALGLEPLSLNQRLTVINAATNTFVAAAVLGETQGTRPEHMVMSPDGARIYVINSLDFDVSVVSTQDASVDTWPQALVGNSPQALAVSPDSRRLYVTSLDVVNGHLEGSLIVVDVASKSRLATVPFGVKKLYGIAASPDGTRLYIVTSTDAGGRGVLVLDAATNGVITETVLSAGAFGSTIALTPDGRFAYLPRQPNGSQTPGIVDVLDTATNTIVKTIPVSNNPRSAAVSPNGAIVYVAAPTLAAGLLHQLDPVTHASLGATPLVTPIGVAFRADSRHAYVAAANNVYVVDTATNAVAATIPIPSRRLDNSAGNSLAAIVATPPPYNPPGSTPTNFRATTIAGNRVTLEWVAPTSITPSGYVIEGGVTPQQVIASVPTGGTSTSITLDVPTGAFYVRVRAVTASGSSGASNEIRILVNLPQAPSAPTALLGLADGGNVTLSWTNTSTGGAPESLVLDVGGALSTSLPLPLSETFSFSGVPAGTYTFAVRAINVAGASSPSPAVTLTFPNACPGAPQAPPNLAVTRSGSVLTVSWDAPAAGPAVSSYVLNVSGALTGAVPIAGRSLSGAVPSGAYTLSVRAVNPCGAGIESVSQSITVP